MNTFYAKLLTPDKTLFEGEVTSLTANIEDGGIEILANFQPSVCYLTAGKCKVTLPSGEELIFVSMDGILDVRANKAILTSSLLEWEENIEDALAIRQAHIEQERKRRQESFKESRLTSVALTKALLKVTGVKKNK